MFFYRELSLTNNSYGVNSFVADFSIEPTPESLDYPLIIKFQHISASDIVLGIGEHMLIK